MISLPLSLLAWPLFLLDLYDHHRIPSFLLYFFWFFYLRLVLENNINESGEKGITSIYYMINHTIIVSHYLLSLIINYGLIRQTSVSIDVWWRDSPWAFQSWVSSCRHGVNESPKKLRIGYYFGESSRVFIVLERSDY